MTWPCFWMEPTGEGAVGYRRYVAAPDTKHTCATGYHSGFDWTTEKVPVARGDKAWDYRIEDSGMHEAKHWPQVCDDCGMDLPEDTNWQRWIEPLYRRVDTGDLLTLHWSLAPPGAKVAPVGAMWDSWWHFWNLNPDKPDDGIILNVRCPAPGTNRFHDWCVDSAASSGGFWTRTGNPKNPPSLTASPSIAIGPPGEGHYHGFLQQGVLTAHLG